MYITQVSPTCTRSGYMLYAMDKIINEEYDELGFIYIKCYEGSEYVMSGVWTGTNFDDWNGNGGLCMYYDITHEKYNDAYLNYLDDKGNLKEDASIEGVEDNDIMWGDYRVEDAVVTDLDRLMLIEAFQESKANSFNGGEDNKQSEFIP